MIHLRTPLALLLLAALLGACGEAEIEETNLLPSVSAARIEAIDLEPRIRASGDLNAKLHTTVSAEIQGRVTGITVEEGESVEEGAVVVELDPERRQLELVAARARQAQAQAQYGKERRQTERVRKLSTQNVASEQKLDEAEAALELARAQLAAARAEVGVLERAVADASVAAPFAGRVARRHVDLGEFVQPGKALFELVDLDPLEVVFSLTELDSERVGEGQEVTISVGAFPDRSFNGTVSFISPTVDPATRTLRIKAEVANDDGLLRPGLFARVSLGAKARTNVMMVPEEALIQRSDGALLFRIGADDRVEQVRVATGVSANGRVEVRGDVAVGDRIVRRGHGGLADGAEVVVVEGPRSSRAPRDVADTELAAEPDAEAAAEL